MTKRNPYLQHTYESFDQPVPPRRYNQTPEFEGLAERILNSALAQRFRSPIFATAALLVTGAAFAGIIIATYPDSQQGDENIPVITADASPLREVPADPGGMDVAHEDSTVYSSIRSAGLQEAAPIENLLAEEKPVDMQTAFASEDVTAEPPSADALQSTGTAPPSEMADARTPTEEAGQVPPVQIAEKPVDAPAGTADAKPALAPAANSPETLAYVRSVLDQKEKDSAPTEVAAAQPENLDSIEPTAGASATAAAAIKPGNYYVQLASISSESAAPKEWVKLQKTYSALSDAKYRVQRADLGAKGIFYRIQAGPMSKDSAKSICDAVKAQKPGGCIIVQ